MTRPAWGFTHRPYPTMTGHIIATRQASGAQKVFRNAIEAGEFVFAPPIRQGECILEQ